MECRSNSLVSWRVAVRPGCMRRPCRLLCQQPRLWSHLDQIPVRRGCCWCVRSNSLSSLGVLPSERLVRVQPVVNAVRRIQSVSPFVHRYVTFAVVAAVQADVACGRGGTRPAGRRGCFWKGLGRDPEDAAAFGHTSGKVCGKSSTTWSTSPSRSCFCLPAVGCVHPPVDPDPVCLGAVVLGSDRHRNLVPARRQVHLVAVGHHRRRRSRCSQHWPWRRWRLP